MYVGCTRYAAAVFCLSLEGLGLCMRVLAFAAEAWETKLLLGVLQDTETFASAEARRIVLSDVTSIQYDREFLRSVQATPKIEVDSLESLFASWQQPDEHPPPPVEYLEQWAERMESRFDRQTLIASDIILSPWERGKWLLPTDPSWAERIAADQVAFAERQFKDFAPDVVLCVERRRLVGLAAQVVAEAKGIPCLTLVFTRVGNRWMVRRDGGIGMSQAEYSRLKSHRPSAEASREAQAIAHQVRQGWPLYDSLARQRTRTPSARSSSDLSIAIKEAAKIVRLIAVRHAHPRGGVRAQQYQSIRYEQDFYRLSKAQLRQAIAKVRAALPLIDPTYDRFDPERATSPFVLWLLHTRPEDGVSSMGRGQDELEVLLELQRVLPDDIQLVAKEHLAMIGIRSGTFYERMRGAGIRVLAPQIDSSALLRFAGGLAGLSGTGLLEGLLVGKPTLVLGDPEFISCTSFSTWSAVEAFTEAVRSGEPCQGDARSAAEYLAWVLDNSDEQDLFWGDLDSEVGRRMIQSVALRFMCLAQEVSA